jgi:hypothetical protein
MTSDKRNADNLFECLKCGDCCKGYGGTYVSESDIDAIADYLDMEAADFKSTYCEYSGGKPVLSQKSDGYCVFWDELCTIHPVKPRMCRRWPYIRSVLVDINNWYAMGSMCPGIRRDASPQEIRRAVARILAKEGPHGPLGINS